jgi:hypothetical protein
MLKKYNSGMAPYISRLTAGALLDGSSTVQCPLSVE